MFVSQAHSFQQQARLAITLAMVAGYTNIITILTCTTVSSHMTGITSALGSELVSGHGRQALFALFLLVTFFVGAALSGFSTEIGRRHGWESIYVLPMVIEIILLAAFALVLEVAGRPLDGAHLVLLTMTGLAACAMGLQNATITRISSGVVRTTHVTGVLTDFGAEAVQLLFWFRDRHRNMPPASGKGLLHGLYHHPPARHVALLATILAAFAFGAAMGTVIYGHWPRLAMFPPVAFLIWIVYQDMVVPIAAIESSVLAGGTGGTGGMDLPPSMAVFHMRKDRDRKGTVHRMPNLLAWAERLPSKARVIVLDLGEVTRLDTNAVLELRALLERFKSEGRQLIIAGVNAQFHDLQSAGAEDLLPLDSLCSDFELAIAKGLNLTYQLAPGERSVA